jgi:hypothetical protein
MPMTDMQGEEPPPVDAPPPVARPQGPCDIDAAGNVPCVAALQNTGTGGELRDICLLPNGFADAASVAG